MPKKTKINSIIALEIGKYEAKIREFQIYLETHDVRRIGEINKDEDKYKEIDTQIKILNALPNWLEALKRLKEVEGEATEEMRGESEINDAHKFLKGNK